MLTFSYFIIIKICLYLGLAHFMLLILAFVFLFWFLSFGFKFIPIFFIIYLCSFHACDRFNQEKIEVLLTYKGLAMKRHGFCQKL